MADPDAVRRALLAAGAQAGFRGTLRDRRFDRNGEFTSRDEVVRLRQYRSRDGSERAQLGWKGPTRRSAAGY
ncbi:MAG TPA: hypothetical protein VLT61_06770, partial [Anaeromyxobacteraceae bacterium]|nr:hypothetical protein [Anaeromyxobacteraceae bacterium]